MTAEYIQACYKELKKEVMGSCDSGDVRIDNCGENVESFMGIIALV